MRCLIIDNHDSFTWNLADYVAQVYGQEPTVIYNDQCSWEQARDLEDFGCIVVSPGPGSVTNHTDFHASRGALEQNDIPVLGVCLGFQGLAHIYGGKILRAPVAFHGRKSIIQHNGAEMFHGVPKSFEAVRYHSLIVKPESISDKLRVTASTDCGLVMALEHKQYPKWGMQFHPESILTQYGKQLVSNFHHMALRYARENPTSKKAKVIITDNTSQSAARAGRTQQQQKPRLKVFSRKLPTWISPITAFSNLYAHERNCFWLDTQSIGAGSPRFSFIGSEPDGEVLSCRINAASKQCEPGKKFITELEQKLEEFTVVPDYQLPFDFCGGYVGFMSYEMKAVFNARNWCDNPIPDALWMRVTKFLAFDHLNKLAWIVAIDAENQADPVNAWMQDTEQHLAVSRAQPEYPPSRGLDQLELSMNFSREQYLETINQCQEKILAGESYEICLTNQFEADIELDPFELYMVMRSKNPAPFGAFIKSDNVCILSTSPERFLKVDAKGHIQAKPIKGTSARADDPAVDADNARSLAASEKDRAENLMIVDLMRNDLRRVSLSGSVEVPKLMKVESYQTVHQLVSTIESRLNPECSLVDLLHATFPGGSITGAPKKRTMEIIDELEDTSRGAYCGTIGYLGYNKVADLNIAIRSLSYDGKTVRFGAGGAITSLSDPVNEFEEIMLKAESILAPLWQHINQRDCPLNYKIEGNKLQLANKHSDIAATIMPLSNPWLIRFNRQERPNLRVFCFPYAGGDANIFRSWSQAMPDQVEVIGIQYPGRGVHDASPIEDHHEMVQQLHRAIAPMLDCDFVFFGHSNGALISFELARSLSKNERAHYLHHFFSARSPVHLPPINKNISELDDIHFIHAVKDFGGTPEDVLNDQSLLEVIIPRLRADFRLAERYVYQDGPKVDCDATAFYGIDDQLVDSNSIHRWAELVAGDIRVHGMNSGHFFLHTHTSEVLAILRARIDPLLHNRISSSMENYHESSGST